MQRGRRRGQFGGPHERPEAHRGGDDTPERVVAVRGIQWGVISTGEKLFSTKLGFAKGMVQALGKIWCPVKGIRCKDLGENLFLFTFLQPGGKR
jgi:hypothetical protein